MVSIIIRTKNEERWITEVLRLVFGQEYRDIEVIIVDNHSTDKTLEKARKFDVKIISIDSYFPGKAINIGIKAAKGEYIACLSAHCLPVNNKWLGNLLGNFTKPDIAGVYGRQEPMAFSSDSDKRDLSIAFGLDKRIQEKDSFFHNANSMIRRDLWEKYPFDDKVTNIEDRVWAKHILAKGYKIIYEPEARVYHYHGIHQNGDKKRCEGVANVLKNIEVLEQKDKGYTRSIKQANVLAFIPVKGQMQFLAGRPLLEYTLEHAKKSKYIKNIMVLTDNSKIRKLAQKAGATVPFLRDSEEKNISLDETLRRSLEKIEQQGIYPDIIAVLWVTFPFRKEGYIDRLIYELVSRGLDSVISVKPFFETCWQEQEKNNYVRLDSGNVPREMRKKMYIGIEGLGYVTYPDCIRKGHIYSDNIGVVEVHDPVSAIKVRDKEDFALAEKIADYWFLGNKHGKK